MSLGLKILRLSKPFLRNLRTILHEAQVESCSYLADIVSLTLGDENQQNTFNEVRLGHGVFLNVMITENYINFTITNK